MKKLCLWASMLLAFPCLAHADKYSTITISQTSEDVSYSISKIKKITFDDDYMTLHLSDGDVKMPLTQLNRLFFSNDAANIGSIGSDDETEISVSNGELTVKGKDNASVCLIDMSGKVIRMTTITGGEATISLNGLQRAVYVVKVSNGKAKKIMNR